jgi:hypothetical protein
MNRFAVVFFALALIPGAALASQQGQNVIKNWRSMDQCAKEAQTAFPDFTPESNTNRDIRLKDCLAGKNLPPRERAAPRQ